MSGSKKHNGASLVTFEPTSSKFEYALAGVFIALTAISFWRWGEYFSEQNELAPEWSEWAVKWPLIVTAIGVGLQVYLAAKDIFLACKDQCRFQESEPLTYVQTLYVYKKTKCQGIREKFFTHVYGLMISVFTGFFVAAPFLVKELLGIKMPSNSSDASAIEWKFESQPQVSIFLIAFCTLFQFIHAYKNWSKSTTHTLVGTKSPIEHIRGLFLPISRECAGFVEIKEFAQEEVHDTVLTT